MDLRRDRRLFLKAGSAIAASAAWGGNVSAAEEQKKPDSQPIRIGIMGTGGRGGALAKGFMAADNVRIQTLCDVDTRATERVGKVVAGTQGSMPKLVGDYRRLLDDDTIDAVVVATPNHWHAPATIAACNAGKHVYVEKPCSYDPQEGEWAVSAARNNKRVVQMGTQRRSWPALQEAVAKIHDGVIGQTLYARTWYNNRRGSIGVGKVTPPPAWLDWDLWQGPAARVPYKDNVVHYNWHWHWNWGNGELGNNGVHAIDVARWALDVTYPVRVAATGGRYRFDDDQETPDTMMVSIDFPEKKTITWEGLSWSPLGPHDSRFGMSIHGTEGSIVIRGSDYVRYDMMDKEVETKTGAGGDSDHLADFTDAIRNDRLSNADILQAHRSTLLCHLGNIAYRTGTTLETNPADGHITNSDAGQKLWSRKYADGFQPVV